MFRIQDAFKKKLTWYLMSCVLVSGLLSVGCGYLIIYFGLNFIEDMYDDQSMNRNFQVKYMEDLQEFVTDREVTAERIDEIKNWTDEEPYVYLSIYKNNKVIFNSDYSYYPTEETEGEDAIVESELLDSEYLYRLALADGSVASVDMFCYDYWKYSYYVWTAGIVIGGIFFAILFTKLLQRRLRYINEIEKELQILEGGNLEYPITVKGEDEIGNLARGIEQMRLSIIENIKKEQHMLQANKDLVTAMSHDLRTPLTTLTGYLELLDMEHIGDVEQRKRYLELSLSKTREIKELSDELFEYFLIYGESRKRIDVEPVPAYALVMDLTESQFLCLEEEGFILSSVNDVDEESGNCMINTKYMQRVLNNILSNIEKYADKEEPIKVSAIKKQNFLVIQVRNKIQKNLDLHESTEIGLITCERIMKQHQGEFRKYEVEGDFTVELIIPMEKKDREVM